MAREFVLMITLHDDEGKRLCGPAMVKTSPEHTVSRILAVICRWTSLEPGQVDFCIDGGKLPGWQSVADAGLKNGNALTAVLATGAPQPSASSRAAPFAMLDVLDSEMSALMGESHVDEDGASGRHRDRDEDPPASGSSSDGRSSGRRGGSERYDERS